MARREAHAHIAEASEGIKRHFEPAMRALDLGAVTLNSVETTQ